LAPQLAIVAGGFLWAPAVAFGLTLPFLLLPEGRLRSPGWRVVVVTAVTGAGIVLVAGSLLPGPLGETSAANPFALAGPAGTVATVLFDVGLALHAGSLVAALVSLVLVFRAARGIERQQLRWVAAGGAAAHAGLLPTILVGLGIAPRANDLVIYPAVLCVPGQW
jgi:two-component system NarL family sensor kinase